MSSGKSNFIKERNLGKISLQKRLVATKLLGVNFSKILPSNLDPL